MTRKEIVENIIDFQKHTSNIPGELTKEDIEQLVRDNPDMIMSYLVEIINELRLF